MQTYQAIGSKDIYIPDPCADTSANSMRLTSALAAAQWSALRAKLATSVVRSNQGLLASGDGLAHCTLWPDDDSRSDRCSSSFRETRLVVRLNSATSVALTGLLA